MNEVEYKNRVQYLTGDSCIASSHIRSCQAIYNALTEKYNSIYWYSYYFANEYENRLSTSELRQYYRIPHGFRKKYIAFSKLEYLKQLLDLLIGQKILFFIVERRHLLRYLVREMENAVHDVRRQRYFLFCFEELKLKWFQSCAKVFSVMIQHRVHSDNALFLSIFYKGTIKAKSLGNDLIHLIFEYLRGEKKAIHM